VGGYSLAVDGKGIICKVGPAKEVDEWVK